MPVLSKGGCFSLPMSREVKPRRSNVWSRARGISTALICIRGAQLYPDLSGDGESLPDTPQLVVQPGTNADGTAGDSYLYLIGIGNAAALMDKLVDDMGCPAGDEQCVGEGPATHKLYYFQAD